ncbi:unnamed protein product [Bemisia tabaci]|uniref:Peptidase M3A/M3B catalytic domain-containing protein n=1 Tax=Bemisia tabaci TaxID=7038 RepID=A0A9N9ZWX4_BEMTA|nr:unnamed protein product [Bemisia tabaci]
MSSSSIFTSISRRNTLSSKKVITRLLKKNVSTWSPLATLFNAKPARKLSLNLENVGLFGIGPLRSFDGFYLLKEQAKIDTNRLLEEAESPKRTRKIVEIFDELSNALCQVADLAEFIRIVHPDKQFAAAAEDACISVSCLVEQLNTRRKLYDSLKNAIENGDVLPTTDVDDHVAKLFLFDFEQSGIHLDEKLRNGVVKLNDYILQTGQRFMAGCSYAKEVTLTDIPASIRHNFHSDGHRVYVHGLCSESADEFVREVAYKIFLAPNPSQEHLLNELLDSRSQLAKVCGFPSYAHRVLKSNTFDDPETVKQFLSLLKNFVKPYAEMDFSILKEVKTAESDKPLAAWDVPYLTNKAKRKWLNVSGKQYAPYFPLGGCMEGLSNLFNCLFGISLVPEGTKHGEVWSPEVYKLAVTHETEGLLGYIYCDFYERHGKPNQDCHFTIQGGRTLPDGSYQNPIVAVVLNFPTPTWGCPSLLTPSLVDNLFHEMGHALHSMLARTNYQHVSGTRCSTDFAEVPSVLMEYFASDHRVVKSFAKHYSTSEPIPDAMLDQLKRSKYLFQASEIQAQVFYSAMDQEYHNSHPLKQSTTEVLAELQNEYYSVPYVPNTAWQLRFSHLVGYGAKYYSYLLSRSIAADIWKSYFQSNPFDRDQGEKYRRECLAFGGGKPSPMLVTDFLKKELEPEVIASSYLEEIDQFNSSRLV